MIFNEDIKERLNTPISYFNTVHNEEPDDQVRFKDYLVLIANGTFKKQVRHIASIGDNKLRRDVKRTLLPAVSIAGVFSPTRAMQNIIDHSGLVAIDIDADKQLSVDEQIDFAISTKEKLTKDKHVLAAHFSASYRGVVVYIPIPYFLEYHPKEINSVNAVYYKAIAKYILSTYDVLPDFSPQSVASLRFLSFDKELHVNVEAELYKTNVKRDIVASVKDSHTTTPSILSKKHIHTGTSIVAIRRLAEMIVREDIDITTTYHKWMRVAYGIATSFGEEGRESFHKISSIYPLYDYYEANTMYTTALRTFNGNLTVGTVFKMAFDHGITYKNKDDKGFQ